MDLTAVDELLTTTRSVRRRLDLTRPVERSVIQQCLELAVWAPTGGDTARYHFVIVTDATKRGELAKLYCRGGCAHCLQIGRRNATSGRVSAGRGSVIVDTMLPLALEGLI